MSEVRTIIEFNVGTTVARTVSINHNIPAEVGHTLSFDHPSLKECISGTVTRISHTVFLDASAITYIDVAVQGMGAERYGRDSDELAYDPEPDTDSTVDNLVRNLNQSDNDDPFGGSSFFLSA